MYTHTQMKISFGATTCNDNLYIRFLVAWPCKFAPRSEFMDRHPGGPTTIVAWAGKEGVRLGMLGNAAEDVETLVMDRTRPSSSMTSIRASRLTHTCALRSWLSWWMIGWVLYGFTDFH